MTKTAFIGLGVMGFSMAGHLRAKGHEVTVFNRNASRAEAWVAQHGGADKAGRRAASPAEAARNADFVFICVGNDADVRAVTYGTDGVLAGLAEGMNFAAKAGLDGAKLIETISKGAAQSWQMENRALTMLAGKFDFGFAVDWMRKDLSICLAEANRNKARLPLTALVDQFYAQVQARGGARWDTSSLMHLLAND